MYIKEIKWYFWIIHFFNQTAIYTSDIYQWSWLINQQCTNIMIYWLAIFSKLWNTFQLNAELNAISCKHFISSNCETVLALRRVLKFQRFGYFGCNLIRLRHDTRLYTKQLTNHTQLFTKSAFRLMVWHDGFLSNLFGETYICTSTKFQICWILLELMHTQLQFSVNPFFLHRTN